MEETETKDKIWDPRDQISKNFVGRSPRRQIMSKQNTQSNEKLQSQVAGTVPIRYGDLISLSRKQGKDRRHSTYTELSP
jgi:hypothetical protein